jgi:putative nucleotidyltransferase with HDIG domain
MPRNSPISRVTRAVTLLRAFVLASAVLLLLGALVLGSVLTHALRRQAIDDAKVSLTQYTSGVLSDRLVSDGQVQVGSDVTALVRDDLDERPDIVSVKVWRADGVLAWTSLNPERIGKTYPLGSDLREVLETGEAEASLEQLDDEEDVDEAGLGLDHVLEVYAPLVSAGRVIGAFEIYTDARSVEASIAGRKRIVWAATAGVFLALWALLLLLARTASDTLRRQTRILRERSVALGKAYDQLETNALEAIETLNATVEAKDPYTAGHSRRVQRVAVAIAEELGLSPRELDALRLGALLHDIGKIAVPDQILTKPGRLTAEEYDVVKRHSAEGARIVGNLGRLRETVPIVRHHHERADGRGYPDGLSAGEIPLAAAVVGLSDAWDAMTTDRPYQDALTTEAALAEVRRGRGSQFLTEVFDAFFCAVEKRPAEFGIAEDPAQLAVG